MFIKGRQTDTTIMNAEPNSAIRPVERWLTTGEASRHLNIAPITLRRWIKDGKIKPRRTPGGKLRFQRESLDAVLVEKEVAL